jgi:hypothetical protein
MLRVSITQARDRFVRSFEKVLLVDEEVNMNSEISTKVMGESSSGS